MEDLSFSVGMVCPTCGCAEFEYETPKAGQDFTDDWKFVCRHCGREMTRAELIEANSASINAAIQDSGDVIAKEIEKQLSKARW